jgi:RES domain-containing protein
MGSTSIRLDPKITEHFLRIGEHLRYKSRFSLPPDLNKLVSDFVSYQLENYTKTIAETSVFARARIEKIDQEKPFTINDMGSPPRGRAGAGRINPEGISYLYLADTHSTAIAEVRPWVGANVAVGDAKITRNLSVVSLKKQESIEVDNKSIEKINKNMGSMLISLLLKNYYFSAPTHNDDKLAYPATQYISEMFKHEGADGIEYKSVLHKDGSNIALFDTDAAICTKITQYKISSVSYEYKST